MSLHPRVGDILVHGTSLAANAGHSLDPEELARGDVSRSKQAIAAAARDLAYHERWLKEHLAAEERSRRQYARVVRREQTRERRRNNQRRLARSGTRMVLTLARSSRSIRLSLLDEAAYSLGQLRQLTLLGAAWAAPKARAASSWTRGSISSAAALSGAKGRALAIIAGKAALTSLAWTRAKSRNLATAWHEKAAIGGSWLAEKASASALASFEAASSSASWIIAKGHEQTVILRRTVPVVSARIAAKMRDLASVSAEAAGRATSWTRARSRGFALATRRTAATGAAAVVAASRALARAGRGGASTGRSWVQARSRGVLLELRHASSMASPWARGAASDAAVRLLALRSAAKKAALRRSERVALLAVRLRAQILVESDALNRAWRRAIPVRR
jgi:hypothetical protein